MKISPRPKKRAEKPDNEGSADILKKRGRKPDSEGSADILKERAESSDAPKKGRRFISKAAGVTVDVISSSVSAVFKALGSVLLIFLVTGMLFACVFAYYVKTCLTPDLDISLEDYKLSESSTIWQQDSAGNWSKLVTLSGSQKRVWVDYDVIPAYMEKAVIAIEDKRFYEHKGVDWYRTAGAFVQMFARMETSYGGSTVTQQLIKNLTGNDEVTVQRKLGEIFGALELEKKYDKKEIMEWYLNAVYFGEGCWGVQTAAQTYFGKDISQLSLAECAAIAGITNLPTYYDPFYNEENNKNRQETILREMYEQGFINHDEYVAAVAEELVFTRSPGEEYAQEVYSYYEEVVIDDVIADLVERKGISRDAATHLLYNSGYQIYCCLDSSVQAQVDAIYTDLSNIPWASATKQLQSSIVIMNPYDGRILALSGGVGDKTANFELNRATGTYRSPGSSIKPLASYGPAVELGYITPNTVVNDAGYIRLNGTDWYPQNDGGGNLGIVTIYQALQYSLNTVAAQIVDKLGPETSYNYLTTKLGFTSLVPDDASYAPMALGQLTYGATVREMAQAYCSFVNDGIFTYGRTYTLVTDRDGITVLDNSPETIVAFSPNTAYTMTYMMQNAVENGTGREAQLYSTAVAGKTGTSGDYKDRWFVGCTKYYVAAVWTGFDDPGYIGVSGNPAAQLWKKVMKPLHDGLEYKSFTYPLIEGNTGIFGYTDATNDYASEYSGDYESDMGDGGYVGDGSGYSGDYYGDGGGSGVVPSVPDSGYVGDGGTDNGGYIDNGGTNNGGSNDYSGGYSGSILG